MYFLSTIQYSKESYIYLYIYTHDYFYKHPLKAKLNDFEYIAQMWTDATTIYCRTTVTIVYIMRFKWTIYFNYLLLIHDCNDSIYNYTLTRIVSLLNSIQSVFLFYCNWSDLQLTLVFPAIIIFSENALRKD